MSNEPEDDAVDAKELLEKAANRAFVEAVWRSSCEEVLPLTLGNFALGNILPAVFFMLRWGERRGAGRFAEVFSAGTGRRPTVASVVQKLKTLPGAVAVDPSVPCGDDLLGDLLLAFCLENDSGAKGHRAVVQRVFPSHFFASWIDLPKDNANLRKVPELVTALLVDPQSGNDLEPAAGGNFPLGSGVKANLLTAALAPGVVEAGGPGGTAGIGARHRFSASLSQGADAFDEGAEIDVDQLLTVRLAEACERPPARALGNFRIPNVRPVAGRSAERFRADLRQFVEAYSTVLPRQSFLQFLEAGLSLGLTELTLSTMVLLEDWDRDGRLPPPERQAPCPQFVDASNGGDAELRAQSERSLDAVLERYERFAVLLACVRVADREAGVFPEIHPRSIPPATPDATARLNFVGALRAGRHPAAAEFRKHLKLLSREIHRAFDGRGQYQEAADELLEDQGEPALAIGRFVRRVMPASDFGSHQLGFLRDCARTDTPDGLWQSRKTTRSTLGNVAARTVYAHGLPDAVLEFLVLRALVPFRLGRAIRPPSYKEFLEGLRTEFGLHLDKAPPGQGISQDLLDRNRHRLERRLRDLGVLTGVNDAEDMKRLRLPFGDAP